MWIEREKNKLKVTVKADILDLYTAPAAALLDLHSEDARTPLFVESPEFPLKFLPRLPGPANFPNRFTVGFGIVFRDDFELARRIETRPTLHGEDGRRMSRR